MALRVSRVSKLLQRVNSPIRSVAAPSIERFFNTSVQTHELDDNQSVQSDRPSNPSSISRGGSVPSDIFSDVFNPFYPSRSLSQVLNMMDKFAESPFFTGTRGTKKGWDVREDKNGLYVRIDMPGLGKEHVTVSAEQNTLIIRGEGEKEYQDDEYGPRYSSRIDLPIDLYKMDQIKAEMKNGVLKIFVPKTKDEERKDVYHVSIE